MAEAAKSKESEKSAPPALALAPPPPVPPLGEVFALYLRGEAMTVPTAMSVLVVGAGGGARVGCKRIEHLPGIGFRAVLNKPLEMVDARGAKTGHVRASWIVPYAQCVCEEMPIAVAEPVKA